MEPHYTEGYGMVVMAVGNATLFLYVMNFAF